MPSRHFPPSFGLSETYDYYLERHARKSINGLDGGISAIVRVGNYDNAHWDGTKSLMVFGDGNIAGSKKKASFRA